jgi:hypothetical protein
MLADAELSRRVERVEEYVEDEEDRFNAELAALRRENNDLINSNRQLKDQLEAVL